jgi:hypothetical protein
VSDVPRKVAGRPAGRTVDVEIEAGDYAGWAATARADFPARVVADLQSGDIDRVLSALDRIVVSHNMPGTDGELAPAFSDVDPYQGMLAVAGAIMSAIQKLPNR